MPYKKVVKGERIGAAIVDAIIIGIIGFVISLFSLVFIDIDDFFEQLLSTQDTVTDEVMMWSIVMALITLAISIIYYVVIPTKYNGQTLGKRIFSIKVVDDLGENPPFKIHFLRSIMLWGDYIGTPLMLLYFVNPLLSTVLTTVVGTFASFVIFLSMIFILARDDALGIHDLLAGTMVVDKRFDPKHEFVEAAVRVKDWASVDDLDADEDDPFMNIETKNKDDDD